MIEISSRETSAGEWSPVAADSEGLGVISGKFKRVAGF